MTDEIDRAQAREAELLQDALAAHQRQRLAQAARALPAAEFCGEHLNDFGCGEEITAARRAAVPGCQLCVRCQARFERIFSKGER